MKYVGDYCAMIDVPIIGEENSHWSLNELEEILSEAIRRCGRRCLEENHGKIFLALSGGLNSSLILALLRKSIQSDPMILTTTLGHPATNSDVRCAEIVADYFPLIAHKVKTTFFDEDAQRASTALCNERIFGAGKLTRNHVALFLLFGEMSSFYTDEYPVSVLLGHGADEYFGNPMENFENELVEIRRIALYFGITPLFPYLDRRVVEFASRIPVNQRTYRGMDRYPLRAIATDLLPMEIATREKTHLVEILK